MATVSERPRRSEERRLPGVVGIALGLATLGALLGADLLLDDESAAIVGVFVLAPFVTAALGGPWATAAVAGLALALAAASPEWNMNSVGDPDWVARVAAIFVGGCFAVAAARLRRRARERVDRLRLLDSVGAVADGSLPLAETLRRVTDVIVPAVGDICLVDAVHDGRATRIATRAAGREDAEEIEARLRGRPSSAPEWLIRVQRPWRKIPRWMPRMSEEDLRRLSHGSEDLEFLRSLGVRSSISTPIRARDRNLGVLTLIMAWSGRRYDLDDLRFAQILSGRMGLALDNAGLFSDLESIERRMDTVMSILDEAIVIHGADGELVFANPAAAEMLGFASPDEAISTPGGAIAERYLIRDERGNEVGAAALSAPAGVQGASRTLRAVDRETGRERWLRTRTRSIDGSAGETIYSVTAIEDVTDVKRAEFAQRLLARTGELISHSEDYLRTLNEVPHLLVPDFADGCSVNLVGEEGLVEQVAVVHPDPERRDLARELRERYPVRLDDAGGMGRVIRTGQPILTATPEELTSALAGEEERIEAFRRLGVGSTIVVPMSAGGRAVGALTFVTERDGRVFDRDDLELAVELARRAGLAIENARLAGERARVADALQRELLPPSLPRMEGWEMATMYEPAGEVNQVGGDFYDVFPVDRGWAVMLGDVSGRGAPAAALTAEARHTIRTAGALAGNPRAGLRLLDANLRARDDVALCSVAILVVPETPRSISELQVYLAGHPHPLLIRGQDANPIGEPGPLLGVVDGADWEPVTVTLLPDDQVILYTDGVIEARGEDRERFGIERLRSRLAGCRSPAAAVDRVRAALAAFGALAGEDDAALVAIRCAVTGTAGAASGGEAEAGTVPLGPRP